MSGAWSRGSTRAWRRIRAEVLARDRAMGYGCRAHEDGWCERADVGPHSCSGLAEHAHHTLGRARTGDDQAHIVGACETCNLKIGEPTVVAEPQAKPVSQWGE